MKIVLALLALVPSVAAFQIEFNDDVDEDFRVVGDSDERMVLAFNPFLEPYTDSPTLPPTPFPTPFPTTTMLKRITLPPATPAPTDTRFSVHQLDMMHVPASNEGEKATVFVLDTGCQRERFEGYDVDYGPSFVDDGDASTDLNGHGTHVAGLVLAVAPKTRVVCVKIFDARGDGRVLFMVQAAKWVARNCKRNCVLNLSGGAYDSSVLDAVADRLVSKRDVVFVAASGNYVQDKCSFSPARSRYTVGVSSVDDDFTVASFAAFGSCVDVFAPGDSVSSFSVVPNTFVYKSGTSMSAAYVSGLMALIRTGEPGFHALDAASFLIERAAPDVLQPPPDTVRKFARWTPPVATHFSVTLSTSDRITRTWFDGCVSFRSKSWSISFGNARRNKTGIVWDQGFIRVVGDQKSDDVKIVWDDTDAAVFENGDYVFRTSISERTLWLKDTRYENVRPCSRRSIPRFYPCRQRRVCTSPCIRIPGACVRATDCALLTNPIRCAKSAACVWKRDACFRA